MPSIWNHNFIVISTELKNQFQLVSSQWQVLKSPEGSLFLGDKNIQLQLIIGIQPATFVQNSNQINENMEKYCIKLSSAPFDYTSAFSVSY